ncbi:hypothetical protein PRIPAC_97423, partial [Pristionchus pacificus]|uniref:Thioredoxin-like_fold domain-containing protein n=1 Tax=Pristionchus pacificus TaxID=54126 RepID=A0A2A6B2Y2_PRIPA
MAPSFQVRDFQKDVVYLFQFPGNETASSMSPYCVKVEAFCRLHNLKFERRNTFSERGSNGLLPFIELNGVQICESQVILNRLAAHFGLKNYEDALSEGIGHALEIMIENHTLHLLRIDLNRTLGTLVEVIVKQRVPAFAVGAVSSLWTSYMRRKTRAGVKDAIGQFTVEEYDEMLRKYWETISSSWVDYLALAHIGHAYFRLPHARSYIHELIDSAELSVFKQYLERLVRTIFGDKDTSTTAQRILPFDENCDVIMQIRPFSGSKLHIMVQVNATQYSQPLDDTGISFVQDAVQFACKKSGPTGNMVDFKIEKVGDGKYEERLLFCSFTFETHDASLIESKFTNNDNDPKFVVNTLALVFSEPNSKFWRMKVTCNPEDIKSSIIPSEEFLQNQ